MNMIRSEELEFVETEVRVRYAETDQMGVAHNANYFVWFEVGRVTWCEAKGFSYREMEGDDDHFLMVAESSCRFKSPARFDDLLVIRTAVRSATDKVIRFAYEVLEKKSRRILATGETAHVVTDRSFRPARLPARYHRFFPIRSKR
jgi:acyl-CoA thioester hydrolase